MARKQSANFIGMNRELSAADEALAIGLAAADISVVAIDGKEVPVADAPLQHRIAAYVDFKKTGNQTAPDAQLVKANETLANENESLKSRVLSLEAMNAGLTQKTSEQAADLVTAKNSINKLTSDYAAQGLLLEASNNEVKRVTGLRDSETEVVSKACISVNCLPLAKDATDAAKLEAANKIPVAEKITALMGAIHSSAASIGVDLKKVPAVSGVAAPDNGKKLSADAQIAKALAGKK